MELAKSTYHLHTLGCKLNYSESSTISRDFRAAGMEEVGLEDGPGVFVINTCSVTDNADKKCRSLIRSARKRNPNTRVVVMGCYAQLKPQEIAKIPGVDLVIGAHEKFKALEWLQHPGSEDTGRVIHQDIEHTPEFKPGYSSGDRTRSFLKVQDGCDYSCTFCTIPLARGSSRSGSAQEILDMAHNIVAQGAKEIVLTGVNIGDYGSQKGDFLKLLQSLEKVEGLQRIRISSIEPNLLSNEIIDFTLNSKVFMPHFHIPLQSGSNKVLKRMRRRYLRELYAERVERIKSLDPLCNIGVDVIVGFPGESRADFDETVAFIMDLPVGYLHVFTYSERENTPANTMPDPVDPSERAYRSKRLHLISDKKKRAYYDQFRGRRERVLWEARQKEGLIEGYTDHYILVRSQDAQWEQGQMHKHELHQLESKPHLHYLV